MDSRVIPGSERLLPGPDHHNVGIFYEVGEVEGALTPAGAAGEIGDLRWVELDAVAALRHASLVEVGLRLAQRRPADGHVEPVAVTGLVEH